MRSSSPSGPPITNVVSLFSSSANCTVVRSRPRSSSATTLPLRKALDFPGFALILETSYPRGMRFSYSPHASSAQRGSLAATATTWSLATRGLPSCRLLVHSHLLAAPDLLEVVELAHRRMHDVHHHVAQVDEHPFAVRLALHAVDARAVLAHALLHAVGERFYLAVGVAAREHHALEHGRQARGIEDLDVVALHVLERLDHHALLHADIH